MIDIINTKPSSYQSSWANLVWSRIQSSR